MSWRLRIFKSVLTDDLEYAPLAVLIYSHTTTGFNRAGERNVYPASAAADTLSFLVSLSAEFLGARNDGFLRWFARANRYPNDTSPLIDSLPRRTQISTARRC